MRWCVLGWIGLVIGCGPAVPADTGPGSDPGGPNSDDGLPPLTSSGFDPLTSANDDAAGTLDPSRLDLSGSFTSGPSEDPCIVGWEVTPLPPVVVLVVDVSGSMVTTLDHDTEPKTPPTTRWFALWDALSTALSDWDATHELGLRTFPSALATAPPDPFACDSDGTAIVPTADGAAMVLDALPPPHDMTLSGASPLRAAIHEARAMLLLRNRGPQRFIVVITDGAPNCAPQSSPPESFDEVDTEVKESIQRAGSDYIRTAVIAFDVPDAPHAGGWGEPIANPRAVLDDLAGAGGFGPSAMVASDVPSLRDRLSALRAAMASQRLRIPDPSYIDYELHIDGTIYYSAPDCTGDHGFVVLDTIGPGNVMHLCDEAAAALQRSGQATILPYCVIAE